MVIYNTVLGQEFATAAQVDPYFMFRSIPSVVATYPTDTANPITRLTVTYLNPNTTDVQWEWYLASNPTNIYRVIMNENGPEGNDNITGIVNTSLDHLDLWLFPQSTYYIRYRQKISGSWWVWSEWATFQSRGITNSFEKYQMLNAGTTTIPL